MSCSGIVAGNTSEYECCPLRFCLLRNTPHSGKIGGTRSSALLLFSSEQNPMDARLFQALLTFSPVSGVLPKFSLETIKLWTRMRFFLSCTEDYTVSLGTKRLTH